MIQASTVPSSFLLTEIQRIGKETILIGECKDYEAYEKLPKVLSYQGGVYSLTGWNSDTHRACWKVTDLVAHILPRK